MRKQSRSGDVPITYMKVPYTHNSELKKTMEKITCDSGLYVKFVETSGYSLQNILEKSDPFKGPTCGRDDCFPGSSGTCGDCEGRGQVEHIVSHVRNLDAKREVCVTMA